MLDKTALSGKVNKRIGVLGVPPDFALHLPLREIPNIEFEPPDATRTFRGIRVC